MLTVPCWKDALGLPCGILEEAPPPQWPLSTLIIRADGSIQRALKEFALISWSPCYLIFLLLIPDSLKAIYLRAYQDPYFVILLKTVRGTQTVLEGAGRRVDSWNSFTSFSKYQFLTGDEAQTHSNLKKSCGLKIKEQRRGVGERPGHKDRKEPSRGVCVLRWRNLQSA